MNSMTMIAAKKGADPISLVMRNSLSSSLVTSVLFNTISFRASIFSVLGLWANPMKEAAIGKGVETTIDVVTSVVTTGTLAEFIDNCYPIVG